MMRRAMVAGAVLLTFCVSDAGALESSTCVGTDFDKVASWGDSVSGSGALTAPSSDATSNAADVLRA